MTFYTRTNRRDERRVDGTIWAGNRFEAACRRCISSHSGQHDLFVLDVAVESLSMVEPGGRGPSRHSQRVDDSTGVLGATFFKFIVSIEIIIMLLIIWTAARWPQQDA